MAKNARDKPRIILLIGMREYIGLVFLIGFNVFENVELGTTCLQRSPLFVVILILFHNVHVVIPDKSEVAKGIVLEILRSVIGIGRRRHSIYRIVRVSSHLSADWIYPHFVNKRSGHRESYVRLIRCRNIFID